MEDDLDVLKLRSVAVHQRMTGLAMYTSMYRCHQALSAWLWEHHWEVHHD